MFRQNINFLNHILKTLNNTEAIVLGADPTHIVGDKLTKMEKVFCLEKGEQSPYWRGIGSNLDQIGLTLNNVHVQNVCRNYFKSEASENEEWVEIAREYWIPLLRKELDEQFAGGIPVLMKTQFILWATLTDPSKRIKASKIYREYMAIPKEDNLLGRRLLAFYRHWHYSLKSRDRKKKLPDWTKYASFVRRQVI